MSCVLQLERRASASARARTHSEQHCVIDVSFLRALAEMRAGLDRSQLFKSITALPPGVTTLDGPICRICLDVGDADSPLVQPCSCSGSSSSTHVECLEEWVAVKGRLTCELCGQPYKEQVLLKMNQTTVKAAADGVAKAQRGAPEPPESTPQQRDFVKLFRIGLWVAFIIMLGFMVVIGAIANRNKSNDGTAADASNSNVN